MKINRRSFLKIFSIGTAGVLISPLPLDFIKPNKYPWFDPKLQYGDWISVIDANPDKEFISIIMNEINKDICYVVPPEFRKRIKFFYVKPRPFTDPYGEKGFVAWKTIPIGHPMPKKRLVIK